MTKLRGTEFVVNTANEDIGLFDYGYDFDCDNIDLINELIEWLSINCTYNFIFTEKTFRIIAGGYSDNRLAYNNKRVKYTKKWAITDNERSYQIRLSNDDNTLFKLVWLEAS